MLLMVTPGDWHVKMKKNSSHFLDTLVSKIYTGVTSTVFICTEWNRCEYKFWPYLIWDPKTAQTSTLDFKKRNLHKVQFKGQVVTEQNCD